VVIAYSRKSPVAGDFLHVAQKVNAYAAAHYPGNLCLLVMISVDEPPPNEEARREIMGMFSAIKPSLVGVVLVVEGEGFAASAKRSFITVVSMTPTIPFTTRVAGTPSEGARKLVRLMGNRLDPNLDETKLTHAMASVRASIAGV
jgi:hypothetical protein